MRKAVLLLGIVATAFLAGCGAADAEPTDEQKKLYPEATGGGQVKAEGDQFTRQSDKN